MKIKVNSLGFYITNVCNLNCHFCDRFNNYAFAGHEKWNEYKDVYKKWAEKIDILRINILGGEPMLNPDFLQWVNGIAEIWPNALIKINTNGTQMSRWPTLYKELHKFNGRVYLSITNHNDDTFNSQKQEIFSFLKGKIKSYDSIFQEYAWKKTYNDIKDTSWPECNVLDDYHSLPTYVKEEIEQIHKININDYVEQPESCENSITYIDENHVRIALSPNFEFINPSVRYLPDQNKFIVHDSDPDRALDVCYLKKCHQIQKGKIYKCPVVAGLPEFIEQFPHDLSEKQKNLIKNYVPAEPDWNNNQLLNFFDNLNSEIVIDQCALCPEKRTHEKIVATNKKIKIVKIKQPAPD